MRYLRRVDDQRDRVIAQLTESFALDEIDIETFESRLESAYRCKSAEDLDALVADLPSHGAIAHTAMIVAKVKPSPIVLAVDAAPRIVRAIFSNIERGGSTVMPHAVRVEAIFGNVELDLRETQFAPGVTELAVRSIFGSVEIAVPADVAVEVHGSAVFGNFEGTTRTVADPNAPTLRIIGSAVFASVVVRTVAPTEVLKVVAELRAQRALPPAGDLRKT